MYGGGDNTQIIHHGETRIRLQNKYKIRNFDGKPWIQFQIFYKNLIFNIHHVENIFLNYKNICLLITLTQACVPHISKLIFHI